MQTVAICQLAIALCCARTLLFMYGQTIWQLRVN